MGRFLKVVPDRDKYIHIRYYTRLQNEYLDSISLNTTVKTIVLNYLAFQLKGNLSKILKKSPNLLVKILNFQILKNFDKCNIKELLELMKSSLSIRSNNEYVELMYFSEDILVVISIINSMDLHHIRLL